MCSALLPDSSYGLQFKVKLFHIYYSFQLSHLKEFVPGIMLIYDSPIFPQFSTKETFSSFALSFS